MVRETRVALEEVTEEVEGGGDGGDSGDEDVLADDEMTMYINEDEMRDFNL